MKQNEYSLNDKLGHQNRQANKIRTKAKEKTKDYMKDSPWNFCR